MTWEKEREGTNPPTPVNLTGTGERSSSPCISREAMVSPETSPATRNTLNSPSRAATSTILDWMEYGRRCDAIASPISGATKVLRVGERDVIALSSESITARRQTRLGFGGGSKYVPVKIEYIRRILIWKYFHSQLIHRCNIFNQ